MNQFNKKWAKILIICNSLLRIYSKRTKISKSSLMTKFKKSSQAMKMKLIRFKQKMKNWKKLSEQRINRLKCWVLKLIRIKLLIQSKFKLCSLRFRDWRRSLNKLSSCQVRVWMRKNSNWVVNWKKSELRLINWEISYLKRQRLNNS